MKIGRYEVVCTVLIIPVLLGIVVMSGCINIKPAISGSTSNQQATPVTAPAPSTVDKPGTVLQSGAGDKSGLPYSHPVITYGAYALWTGKWDTTFFRYGGKEHKTLWELKQVESNISGTYDWDNGQITLRQSKTSGLAIGIWAESPSYKPPDDAGDIEVQQSLDGNNFTGKWRYGSSGDWVGEWNGTRIR